LIPRTDRERAEDLERAAVEELLKLQEQWDADGRNKFCVEVAATRSFEDEFTRSIIADLPLLVVVFALMSAFTGVVFFKRNWLQSRCLLAFGAVVCVLCSIMTGCT
jgi:lipopolysaccharide export LptBFGC system permease protein LptF